MVEKYTGDKQQKERRNMEDAIYALDREHVALAEGYVKDVEALRKVKHGNDDDDYADIGERETEFRADRKDLTHRGAKKVAELFGRAVGMEWTAEQRPPHGDQRKIMIFRLPLAQQYQLRMYYSHALPTQSGTKMTNEEHWELSIAPWKRPANDQAPSPELEETLKGNDFIYGCKISFITYTDGKRLYGLMPHDLIKGYNRARLENAIQEFKRKHHL